MNRMYEARSRSITPGFSGLVVVMMVGTLGACTGAMLHKPDHVGTYALESIDGRPVPVDIDSTRMISAEVTLGADGSWTLAYRSLDQRGSGARDTTVFRNQGKYTLEGQSLTLLGSAADPRPGKGTLAGRTITSTEDGHVMVYRRRR